MHVQRVPDVRPVDVAPHHELDAHRLERLQDLPPVREGLVPLVIGGGRQVMVSHKRLQIPCGSGFERRAREGELTGPDPAVHDRPVRLRGIEAHDGDTTEGA